MSTEASALGLVLRRSDSGESDRRLHVLTEEFGKLDLVGKGARKAKSRLAGSSEPLVLCRFSWAEGRHRRFITGVEPQTSFPGLRNDYLRLLMGLAICEVLDISLPWESPSPGCLELAATGLFLIEQHERPEAVLAWVMSRLMDIEGQLPDWTKCAVSGVPLDQDPAWVSPAAGGFVSQAEAGGFNDRWKVSATTLIVLKKLNEMDEAPPGLKSVQEVLQVLVRFWSGILEKPLPGCQRLMDLIDPPRVQQ